MSARLHALVMLLSISLVACGGTNGGQSGGGGNGGTGGGVGGNGGSGGSGGNGGSGGSGGSGGGGGQGGQGGQGGSSGGSDGGGIASGCSNCPSGYACGSANGVPVCRAPSGIPRFTNVFLILMENTSWSTLKASTNTPYVHSTLMASTAYATDYHGVAHPSLPNYLALVSGVPAKQPDGSAVACDCNPTGTACTSSCTPVTEVFNPCGCPQTGMTIADQLESAGLAWKSYAESIGSACNPTSSGNYAARHVPFIYFLHDTQLARCQAHVIDYGTLAGDLAGTTPPFAFISPNLVDDMHGTGLGQTTADLASGDTWLSTEVPKILASAAYKNGGAIFIVWDEDDASGGVSGTDDPIPAFVISPLAKSGGAMVATKYDHYALLATIEDGLGLPRLGNAATATPMADFFPAQ
jgi:phosphatidylinositol-3-phosphatase